MFMPLMPLAIEQFDLSGYDLVISSSHAVAKGVITGPNQVHISYVHSPMRYAWDLQQTYLAESGLTRGPSLGAGPPSPALPSDLGHADGNGPERMIANSAYIARRIAKVYRRDSRCGVSARRYGKPAFFGRKGRLLSRRRAWFTTSAWR